MSALAPLLKSGLWHATPASEAWAAGSRPSIHTSAPGLGSAFLADVAARLRESTAFGSGETHVAAHWAATASSDQEVETVRAGGCLNLELQSLGRDGIVEVEVNRARHIPVDLIAALNDVVRDLLYARMAPEVLPDQHGTVVHRHAEGCRALSLGVW